MILIREVFIAKPGMASALAKMMKEEMGESRVMTDVVGPYNTVVVEHEAESIAAWEEEMKKYMNGGEKATKPKASGYTEMYTKGRREIYRLW